MIWIVIFLLVVALVIINVWLHKIWEMFENIEEIKRILSEKENNKN